MVCEFFINCEPFSKTSAQNNAEDMISTIC